MKRAILFVLFAVLALPYVAEARGKATAIRGGFGYLYPDLNTLNNAGQLTLSKASALEVGYGMQDVNGQSVMSLNPSIVYANGRMGMGVSAVRAGTGLGSDDSIDAVTAALGFALGKRGSTNFGLSYTTLLESTTTNDGVVVANLNFNPGKRKGVAFGIGAGTTLNDTVTNSSPILATASLGYSGKNRNNNVEAVITFPDIDSTDNYVLGGYVNMGDKSYYLGAGYEYTTSNGTTNSDIVGRVGLVVGGKRSKGFDVSAFVRYDIDGVDEMLFGGTARVAF